ncbi:MAG: histidine phosphatase family protein [Xanthomonadaceae bacterium]|nr:histidine phosphatase family protein [Xanthomonadaceae bacterium]
MSIKTLILVRHAHRDTTLRALDNGLSEKGHLQAKELAEHLMKECEGKKPLLLTSAKTRCLETLKPLALAMGIEVKTDELLMEQLPHESEQDMSVRIDQFITSWETEMPELVIVCSHGDWLPVAIDRMTGQFVDMGKGSCIVITHDGQNAKLSKPFWRAQ